MKRCVYAFTESLPPDADAHALLGGKGAGLAELTRAGFAVPPGFTIITEACQWFYDHAETWPPDLEAQVREHLGRLELITGRGFGAGPNRLLRVGPLGCSRFYAGHDGHGAQCRPLR